MADVGGKCALTGASRDRVENDVDALLGTLRLGNRDREKPVSLPRLRLSEIPSGAADRL